MTDSTRAPGRATGPFAPIQADAAYLHVILQHTIDGMRALFGLDKSVSNRDVYICVRNAHREAIDPEAMYPGIGHLLEAFRMTDRLYSGALIAAHYPPDYEAIAYANLQRRAAEAAKRGTHLRIVESV